MKEFIIQLEEENQRIDKYMNKLLPLAGKSFLYKMFRKKNITLNNKKIIGNERIYKGDCVKIFFSDDTFLKFSGKSQNITSKPSTLHIIYEDADFLVCNKPPGLLSQSDGKNDHLVTHIHQYLINQNIISENSSFRPGICNRLDRNTSGVILSGKNIRTLQNINTAIREKKVKKIYHAIVNGIVLKEQALEGYLMKDSFKNKVSIGEKGDFIKTHYKPLSHGKSITLLEVSIETGKSHQIRAHLQSIGHPIIGDPKYGDKVVNQLFAKDYGLQHQLLHAYNYQLLGHTFTAPYWDVFSKVLKANFTGYKL